MKRLIFNTKLNILVLSFLLLGNTGCLDQLASLILYQNDEANKVKVPEEPPHPLKMIDLKDSSGARTVGWYYENQKKDAPLLIYFHGNGSNIAGNYESGLIDKLASFNIHVAIFDYPKYGLSTGKLNQKGVLSSGQMVIDHMRTIFPKSNFVFWGRSLGCAPATILAAQNNSIVSALVLTSPWNSFWKLAKEKSGLPEAACKKAAKGNEYETEVFAKEFVGPVLIHHGTNDETIPFQLGEDLSKNFVQADVSFVPVDGAGHDNLLGAKEWAEIYRFIHIW